MFSYIVLCLSCLVLATSILGCFVEFPQNKWLVPYGLCIAFAMGALAYLWEPYAGSDLSRYFNEMVLLQRYGMDYFPDALYANTPIANWLLYIVAQTGDFHLFPCISSFVATLIFVFVMGSEYRAERASSKVFFLSLACSIGVIGPLSILIGGRQHLAFAFMLLAVWYDYYSPKRNKVINLGLYCIPILIHTGTAPLYLARIAVLFAKRKGAAAVVFIAALAAFSSGPVLTFLSGAGLGGDLIHEIDEKFFTYQETGIWDWRIYALRIVMVAAATALVCRSMQLGNNGEYSLILLACLVFALLYVTNYHLMSRIFSFVLYGFLPIVNHAMLNKNKDVPIWAFSMLYSISATLSIAYQCVSVSSQWHVAIM